MAPALGERHDNRAIPPDRGVPHAKPMKQKLYSRRSVHALMVAGYYNLKLRAIPALAAFAAQNAGLDPRNYDDLKSYRTEARRITNDWKEFRVRLKEACAEGVTDADIINEAPRSYSGRLTWNGCRWDYCTGQYFPTEYRRAAVTLLEESIRRLRRNREPARVMVRSITELRALNERNGGCWFDSAAMSFFGTRIESRILHGRYFITSEEPPSGPRGFTVRSFDDTGSIDTVGKLCGHSTRAEALDALHQDALSPEASS